MSVIVEYALAPPNLTLAETFATVDVRLSIERTVGTDPSEPVLFTWVETDRFDAFEAAMEADPTVADPTVLSRSDKRLYRLQVTGEAPVVTYPEIVRLGGRRLKARYEDGWWHARTRFPDLASFETYRRYLEANGVEHRVVSQYAADGTDREFDGLTDAQRETLALAYRRGYFSVPREVTATELADELGISNQAVSERLRRGYARLVERGIGP
jgi:predicted DNA binding protein